MATNTIAGVNLNKISELTLDALTTVGFPLSAFTTDFNGDVLPQGETVTTRFVTVPSTQNMASSKASGNSVMTSRAVTLDQYRGVVIGFSDTERTFSAVELSEMYVVPAISALVDEMIEAALGHATEANFGTTTRQTVVTAAAFDADAVADIAEAQSTLKVPASPRNMILKPTYNASLVKDNAIQAAYAYGSSDAIRNNVVPRVHGYNIIEYNGTIPSNSQSLEGFACGKQAIIMAARGVQIPKAGTWYGNVVNITEPNTGLPLQIREYYDGTEQIFEVNCLYGTALGIADYGHLIASAA